MQSVLSTTLKSMLLMILAGIVIGCGATNHSSDEISSSENEVKAICMLDSHCNEGYFCDTSECLSCCPDSAEICIGLCCGECVEEANAFGCETDADCTFGKEWCEKDQCVACDNSGDFCELHCKYGFVDPRNGCQPCECKPYISCLSESHCEKGQVCDKSECLSCCPGSSDQPCIAACCGKCVDGPGPADCTDKTYTRACEDDMDCTCGTNIVTNDCDFGIAECINPLQQCPDFCNGIAGHLEIVCEDNQCIQRMIENP